MMTIKFHTLKSSPMIIPPSRPKAEGTMPYKDWLRTCGINDVQTEDDVVREIDKRMIKAVRYGKRTSEAELKRAFPTLHILRQLDVRQADGRSSDIGLVALSYNHRSVFSHTGVVVISEHAVRRYWAHTGQRPNIEDWLASYPNWRSDEDDVTELYSEDGLLLGERFLATNALMGWHIDDKIQFTAPGIAFRVKTVIPANQLNENQTARWYKLKQEWQNNA